MHDESDGKLPLTREQIDRLDRQCRSEILRNRSHAVAELDQALAMARDIQEELGRIAMHGMGACRDESITPGLLAYLLYMIVWSYPRAVAGP